MMGTLRALLPVRMSFSCSGSMTCQSWGARPAVILARTILRSSRQHDHVSQTLQEQAHGRRASCSSAGCGMERSESRSAGLQNAAQGGVMQCLLCTPKLVSVSFLTRRRSYSDAQSVPLHLHDCNPGAHLLRGASRSVLKVHRVPLLAITPYDALKSSISFTTGSGVVLFILQESIGHLKPAVMLPLAQA